MSFDLDRYGTGRYLLLLIDGDGSIGRSCCGTCIMVDNFDGRSARLDRTEKFRIVIACYLSVLKFVVARRACVLVCFGDLVKLRLKLTRLRLQARTHGSVIYRVRIQIRTTRTATATAIWRGYFRFRITGHQQTCHTVYAIDRFDVFQILPKACVGRCDVEWRRWRIIVIVIERWV